MRPWDHHQKRSCLTDDHGEIPCLPCDSSANNAILPWIDMFSFCNGSGLDKAKLNATCCGGLKGRANETSSGWNSLGGYIDKPFVNQTCTNRIKIGNM